MGHKGALTTAAASPDYYEKLDTLNKSEETIKRNRRAFYWIMRGALSPDGDSGLQCNPTEWWHWSHGDQLWAALEQAPYAFYTAANMPKL